MEAQGIPIHRGYFVGDLRTAEVGWWEARGCHAAFLELAGLFTLGLVGAFAAREVFVSTMGITYAVGDTEESGTADLSKAMQADRYRDGRPVWTPLVAISLLVWFVLAMQCMSTVAIVRRETGGWRWPIFMIVYMNGLAYVVSLVVYQVGRIWFA